MRRPLAAILAVSLFAFMIPGPAQAAPAPLALLAPAALVAPAATGAARPPALYQSTKAQPLYASASTKSKRLVTVKKGSYVAPKQLKGSWVRVSYKGLIGWLPLASARKLAQPRYEAKAKLSLRANPGSGRAVTVMAKGSTAYATGRTSGRYVQLYRTGKTGWTAASMIQRPIVGKYQTNRSTTLYASKSSRTKLATIPADYTAATRTNWKTSTRVSLEYGKKTGWVALKDVSKVPLSTKIGRIGYKASAIKNIRKWCAKVPLVVNKGLDSRAEASVSYSGDRISKVRELITLGMKNPFSPGLMDPNSLLAVYVQYHECAHILQFRAYKYDFTKAKADMSRAFAKDPLGLERMADCMAKVMGTPLSGPLSSGGIWYAGYQQTRTCTSKQLAGASRLIAGKRL